MDILPREIIVNILSRLPIKPLIRCSSVCKYFLSLTLDPYLINSHLNHAASHNEENPSLILNTTVLIGLTHFRSQLHYATQTLANSSCDRIPYFSSFNFNEFRVVGSCNGLLCLLRRNIDGFMFVINPCTGKRIEIPKLLIIRKSVVGMGIGFSPKSNEYKVVKVISGSAAYVFSLSERVWRAVGAPNFKISGDLKSNVCVNGVVHWASYAPSNFIVCFNVADEVFDAIPYPAGAVRQDGFLLAVFSGCLGAIEYEFNNCIHIWVMTHYNVGKSWTRSFTINVNPCSWNCRDVQVLYVLKNGEILILCRNQALYFYDPKTTSFRQPSIPGLPSWFEAVCHVGSLVHP
ncbi:hypothetical protein Vadar_001549 [Vaccinium darrowii]|uniref:Uncharacterized protein n=1 Tax=Vaccinium darrowii TaxID=229202 RepID=A0ACB7Z1Q1_9ERIC|nr:hypothetical protein Vadar_001549 [Vaccinium darrowii]